MHGFSTIQAPMPRLLAAACALVVLAVAGCGSDNASTTVEGQTTPPPVASTTATDPATTTAPATTTTPGEPPKIDAQTAFTKLQACVGGKAGETYQWFAPTVTYAQNMGGNGFTVTLKGKPVTLVVFPYAEAAQRGYSDIQQRLIRLQQVRPTDYATVAATAAQAVGNVLEVATSGALDATAEAKVQSCISLSGAG
jgi:hypothetical protein